jgi:serine/threonine-protein kinase
MAPEQLAGHAATVKSDIYALGLVLHEIYTGKRAFAGATIEELRRQKETLVPPAPSSIRSGIDPNADRLVMRCLERDPRARPASIAQLAAAFPGGDALAAALAAGETPSPEVVAASGLKEGLRPGAALGLLVALGVCTAAVMMMNPRTELLQRITSSTDARVLVERAR